jgi:hypothetical protein
MRGDSVDELIYDVERDAVRVVLADVGGRVLLFHMVTREVPGGWPPARVAATVPGRGGDR